MVSLVASAAFVEDWMEVFHFGVHVFTVILKSERPPGSRVYFQREEKTIYNEKKGMLILLSLQKLSQSQSTPLEAQHISS